MGRRNIIIKLIIDKLVFICPIIVLEKTKCYESGSWSKKKCVPTPLLIKKGRGK